MPIDYSKWDAIELSDDEDFECHPNVDKKSMVRWKQAQIHKERQEREDQRDLLKMEYESTKKYLAYIPDKISTLNELPAPQIPLFLEDLAKEVDTTITDPLRQASLSKMQKWPANWDAPVWGEVLRSHVPWNEEITKIANATVEYLKTEATSENVAQFAADLFKESSKRFQDRQQVIKKQVEDFEKEMNRKLTMDHLVTGFDKTFVNKSVGESSDVAPAADQNARKSEGSKIIETIHSPKQSSLLDEEVYTVN